MRCDARPARMPAWVMVLVMVLGLHAASALAGTKPLEVRAGEGVVLVHLAQNAPAMGKPAPVRVARVDGDKPGKAFDLPAYVGGVFVTMHHFAALPEGRYRIVDFAHDDGCTSCNGPQLPPDPLMPEFEVKAGHVSYLGVVATSVPGVVRSSGQRERVSVAWHDDPDEAMGRRMVDALLPHLQGMPVRDGWATAAGQSAGDAKFRDIRSVAWGPTAVVQSGADGFMFAANFGVVRRWRPGGAIDVMDTGSAFAISSVLETADGTLIAGGEAGTLRSSTDGGKTWVDRGEGLPLGVVNYLTELGGDVVFSLYFTDRLVVYRGRASEGAFRVLGEYPIKPKALTGLNFVPPPALFRSGDELLALLPGVGVAAIDPATGAHEVRPIPGRHTQFKAGRGGTLWCYCGGGLSYATHVSRDGGRRWEKAGFDRFLQLPEFLDAQRGISFQGALLPENYVGMVRTVDGGKTWVPLADPTLGKFLWVPLYSADGSILLMHRLHVVPGGSTARLEMIFSRDDGVTWESLPDRARWVDDGRP